MKLSVKLVGGTVSEMEMDESVNMIKKDDPLISQG